MLDADLLSFVPQRAGMGAYLLWTAAAVALPGTHTISPDKQRAPEEINVRHFQWYRNKSISPSTPVPIEQQVIACGHFTICLLFLKTCSVHISPVLRWCWVCYSFSRRLLPPGLRVEPLKAVNGIKDTRRRKGNLYGNALGWGGRSWQWFENT